MQRNWFTGFRVEIFPIYDLTGSLMFSYFDKCLAPQLVHDFQRRGVNRVAAKIAQEVEVFLDLHSGGDDVWFEHAVECSAFLAWRLTGLSVAVRFRTQRFDYLTATDGDVYGILKYLATVTPSFDSQAEIANDRERYQIVLTPRAHAETSSNVRVIGPSDLSTATGPSGD